MPAESPLRHAALREQACHRRVVLNERHQRRQHGEFTFPFDRHQRRRLPNAARQTRGSGASIDFDHRSNQRGIIRCEAPDAHDATLN
mgnify:CR=1 FL=1